MNSASGDQAVLSANVSPDEVVGIQIFGRDIQNANGISVRFEYDARQVVYDGFDAGDVLPNIVVLPAEHGTSPTFVQISIGALGGQATVNTGLVGTIRFRTTAAFSGTRIRLVRGELGRGGQFEQMTLNISVVLQSGPASLTPDFDGDGVVGFADFVQFAGLFGSRQGDGTYQAKYDLDSDGAIGFPDFLIFTNDFGTSASASGGGGGGGGGDSAPKMYWTKAGTHHIQRANIDGSNVEGLVTVGSEYRGLKGIALDVAEGKMYWANWHDGKIQRADLDGSNVEDLVTGLRDLGGIALGTSVDRGGGGGSGGAPNDDHSNNRSGATSLVLGSSLSGRIETGGDVDYFRVRVNESGRLIVYTTGNLDTRGTLQNSSGSALTNNDDGGSGDNFRIERSVNAGTYYVKVEGYDSSETGDYTLHVRLISDGDDLAVYALYSGTLAVDFSPDGRYIATGDDQGDVGLWDLDSGSRNVWWKRLGGEVVVVTFSPDGRYIAADGSDSNGPYVAVLGVDSGTEIQRTGVDDTTDRATRINSIAFSPNGNYVAIGVDLPWAWIWDLSDGRRSGWGTTGVSEVYAVAFSPNGRYLATGDDAGNANLWEVSSWWTDNADGISMTPGGNVYAVAFSPNEPYLAADGYDGNNTSITIWDVIRERKVREIDAGNVFELAFRPDGRYLAAGDEDGVITFWRTDTWEIEKQIQTGGAITDLAWNHRGNLIADNKNIYEPLLSR